MSRTFQNKNVLVIGGSRGIGAATVARFASEGAKVAFTYLSREDAARSVAKETGAQAFQSDARDRNAVIDAVGSRGALDILVVSAGVAMLGDPLTLDADGIDRMIDINVRAPYHAAVEAARLMPEGGRIILIGSTSADRMPFAGAAGYALTKSALHGLVRGLARDLGTRSITVNVVQPGPTDTEQNPEGGPLAQMSYAPMALKRHAKPAEIAGLIAFLAGPEGAFITGAIYNIDGGFAA